MIILGIIFATIYLGQALAFGFAIGMCAHVISRKAATTSPKADILISLLGVSFGFFTLQNILHINPMDNTAMLILTEVGLATLLLLAKHQFMK